MNRSTGEILGTTLDGQILVDNKKALGATREVLGAAGPPWRTLRGTKPKPESRGTNAYSVVTGKPEWIYGSTEQA